MKDPKTTTAGVLSIIAALAIAANMIVNKEFNLQQLMAAVGLASAGMGGVAAKDANKGSSF